MPSAQQEDIQIELRLLPDEARDGCTREVPLPGEHAPMSIRVPGGVTTGTVLKIPETPNNPGVSVRLIVEGESAAGLSPPTMDSAQQQDVQIELRLLPDEARRGCTREVTLPGEKAPMKIYVPGGVSTGMALGIPGSRNKPGVFVRLIVDGESADTVAPLTAERTSISVRRHALPRFLAWSSATLVLGILLVWYFSFAGVTFISLAMAVPGSAALAYGFELATGVPPVEWSHRWDRLPTAQKFLRGGAVVLGALLLLASVPLLLKVFRVF